MPELSPKQKKLAAAAEPRDKITGEDFKALKKADGGMIENFRDGGAVRGCGAVVTGKDFSGIY
tara:strand:- start:2356 stop:2544 length:189 start_codon:yes stop_codon:yes gene_type:complete